MTPQELITFRVRMGWTQKELAHQLDLGTSRIADYEKGQTRTKPPRPAPIPKVVELACRWLEAHTPRQPLTPEEKAALWRDLSHLPHYEGPPIDDSREGLYGPPRGL